MNMNWARDLTQSTPTASKRSKITSLFLLIRSLLNVYGTKPSAFSVKQWRNLSHQFTSSEVTFNVCYLRITTKLRASSFFGNITATILAARKEYCNALPGFGTIILHVPGVLASINVMVILQFEGQASTSKCGIIFKALWTSTLL